MAEITHDRGPQSFPPAPPSILRSKSISDISITSSDSKASCITFAPLPDIAARKRRNGQPIGLASRAEMLRKSRRQFVGAPLHAQSYEDEQHTPPEDDEIPLPDFGKLVKGLWRSVSRGHGTKGKPACETPETVATTTFTKGINTTGEDEGEEGGVWMEEIAWAPSDPSSPPHSKPSSANVVDDDVQKDTRRDTTSTVDSGSFMNEFDGNKVKREMTDSRITQNDVG